VGLGISSRVVGSLIPGDVNSNQPRVAALALLMVCVGKIVLLDVWQQERSDRYITFIILGAALLFVTFLYTRYSETIRRYL
jgi:uncharacterized membrane protein